MARPKKIVEETTEESVEEVKVEVKSKQGFNKDGAPLGRPLTEKEYIALKNKK
jgi:hypothetical protein